MEHRPVVSVQVVERGSCVEGRLDFGGATATVADTQTYSNFQGPPPCLSSGKCQKTSRTAKDSALDATLTLRGFSGGDEG